MPPVSKSLTTDTLIAQLPTRIGGVDHDQDQAVAVVVSPGALHQRSHSFGGELHPCLSLRPPIRAPVWLPVCTVSYRTLTAQSKAVNGCHRIILAVVNGCFRTSPNAPQAARDTARQARRPGCEELAARIRRQCRRWKRGPRPKTATVERREASVPRHGTRRASLARTSRVSQARQQR